MKAQLKNTTDRRLLLGILHRDNDLVPRKQQPTASNIIIPYPVISPQPDVSIATNGYESQVPLRNNTSVNLIGGNHGVPESVNLPNNLEMSDMPSLHDSEHLF